jgi:membrane protease YdiL (CAAX protease family)
MINNYDSGMGRSLSVRALTSWEILSVMSSVLIAEWIAAAAAGVNKLAVAIPVTLAFAFMIVSHREHGETLKDLGFRLDNFVSAILLLIPPMLLSTVVFLMIGWLSGSGIHLLRWSVGRPLVVQLLLGALWGLAQQYVLQAFINRRTVIVLGQGWVSVLVVAAIFSGLHLPNVWLVVITFIGGLIWAAVYQRRPNLFALAVSHSLMTWVVISTAPPAALHHLRIGFSYFL